MADVFVSYAREDRLAAQKVAETLKRHGWSVWWDPEIPPGKTWDELIERELASASCVVVLWSATSLTKSWVKAEVAEALARQTLVPVLIETVTPPLVFRQIQAAPLMDWRGDLDHAGFQQLLCAVCGLAGLPTRPESKDKKAPARAARAKGVVASARTRPKRSYESLGGRFGKLIIRSSRHKQRGGLACRRPTTGRALRHRTWSRSSCLWS